MESMIRFILKFIIWISQNQDEYWIAMKQKRDIWKSSYRYPLKRINSKTMPCTQPTSFRSFCSHTVDASHHVWLNDTGSALRHKHCNYLWTNYAKILIKVLIWTPVYKQEFVSNYFIDCLGFKWLSTFQMWLFVKTLYVRIYMLSKWCFLLHVAPMLMDIILTFSIQLVQFRPRTLIQEPW